MDAKMESKRTYKVSFFASNLQKSLQTLRFNQNRWQSSAPDGRYPKIWDLPCVQQMRKSTGAQVVPMCMCEWGLGPIDNAATRYKKATWWLVSPGLYMYALVLSRRCSGRVRYAFLCLLRSRPIRLLLYLMSVRRLRRRVKR